MRYARPTRQSSPPRATPSHCQIRAIPSFRVYLGAQWFLEVSYADGEVELALIAKGAIEADDTTLALYSLNLDATRAPASVALYRSVSAYPNVDIAGATLIHTRIITPALDPPMPVLRVGYGELRTMSYA